MLIGVALDGEPVLVELADKKGARILKVSMALDIVCELVFMLVCADRH